MLKIYNIKEKQEFLREVAELTQKEWGRETNSQKILEEKYSRKNFQARRRNAKNFPTYHHPHDIQFKLY